MALKADSPETAELVELFKKIGLTQSKAAEAAKSSKSASILKGIIEVHNLVNKNLDGKQAVLLAALAVQGSKLGDGERSYAVGAVLDGRLKTTDQVSGECHWLDWCARLGCNGFVIEGVKYLDGHPLPVDQADFNQSAGVGEYATVFESSCES